VCFPTASPRRCRGSREAEKAEKNGPAACNGVRASGSGFLTWLQREGIVDVNPFAHTNRAPIAGPRERTPSDAELHEIWNACPDNDYGRIVKILMLVGARKTEVADLRWSEIDFEQALITLPPRRAKGGRTHEIPLSDPVLAILKTQPQREGRDFVFGSGQGGFSGWSKGKAELDQRIAAARLVAAKTRKPEPMPEWRLHDLRRAFSTGLHEKLGVQPHIVEECLGHATFRQGVASVYNKAEYRNEKRRALELWAEHLTAIVEGREQKVVPLHGT
jgi:integrase